MVKQNSKLEIRVTKLRKGTRLALENAIQYAEDANLLLEKGGEQHAYGLVILGFEELGKARTLLKAYYDTVADGKKIAEIQSFYDHKSKLLNLMNTNSLPYCEIFATPEYKEHLKQVEQQPTKERESAFYVDNDAKRQAWVKPKAPPREIIFFDIQQLRFFANGDLGMLLTGAPLEKLGFTFRTDLDHERR